MADIQYVFRNDTYGGSINATLAITEMPDWFPWAELVSENKMRGARGKQWRYEWYRLNAVSLPFRAVGSAIVATMGTLAREGYPFLWYDNWKDASCGTHVMVFSGGESGFGFTPLTPTLYDFDFPIESYQDGVG